MAPDVRKPPILRNAPLYLGALLTHRETFGLLANWLQGPLSFLCLLLPNVKDEPRPRLAPKAAPQPTCQTWALALAPC